ncbi:MAG: aminoacetone oxidase family FAD-binding enzyme [Coriobacteriia bacterium]|nr:aminoacetone oxidase family FAD-binding enzyme [Coriobacteriia bacterium]
MAPSGHSENDSFDIAIIGGGPAGLFAGISAMEENSAARVVIFEHKSKVARKLLITGGGQCNLTNTLPMNRFVSHYGDASSTVRRVLYGFNNVALAEWFCAHGLKLVTRSDGKVFPHSFKSVDVLETLVKTFQKAGGSIKCRSEVGSVDYDDEANFCIVAGGETYRSGRLIVATGGITYPQTGSDGSAEKLFSGLFRRKNIETVPFESALTPLYPRDYAFDALAGVSLDAVEIHSSDTKNAVISSGGLLFRSDSLSGPAVLDASRYLSKGDRFEVNLVKSTAKSIDSFCEKFEQVARSSTKKTFTEVVHFASLPKRLVECLLKGWPGEEGITKSLARDLSKAEIRLLAGRLMRCPFVVETKGGANQGMVSSGGVPLSALDMKTMRASAIPGLYFCGEIVDVIGDTGGFNLQWAFSSARLAGKSAATSLGNDKDFRSDVYPVE